MHFCAANIAGYLLLVSTFLQISFKSERTILLIGFFLLQFHKPFLLNCRGTLLLVRVQLDRRGETLLAAVA